MTQHNHKNIIADPTSHQQSPVWQQDSNIPPHFLSGDENITQSMLLGANNGQKANFLLTTTTIVKTVIGSGIVSLPYVVNQMGWILGTMLFIIAAVLNQFSSVLLLKAKNLSGHSNFHTIFYEVWSNKMAKVIGSLFIISNNLGVCIIEVIILKSAIRNIFIDLLDPQNQALNQFYTSQIFIVLVIAILWFPIILLDKIQKLRFAALSGAVGIIIFMLAFVIFFIQTASNNDPRNQPAGNMRAFPTDWFKAAAAVPNIILALAYQMNIFPIFKGMKNPSDSRMSAAVALGITFCTLSYLLVGILGYYYVGDSVGANFLNYLSHQKLSTGFYCVIKLSFLLSVFFAFPLMFFGGRNNFMALIQLIILKPQQQHSKQNLLADNQETLQVHEQKIALRKKRANKEFILYSIGLYIGILLIGMFVQNIQAVFNLVGSISASSLCILLPCFFYVRLIQMKKQRKTINYYASVCMLAVMTPYSLFSIAALYV